MTQLHTERGYLRISSVGTLVKIFESSGFGKFGTPFSLINEVWTLNRSITSFSSIFKYFAYDLTWPVKYTLFISPSKLSSSIFFIISD